MRVTLGWFTVYLPDEPDPLGLLTVHDPDLDRDIGRLTNRPIPTATDAETVFITWRGRPQIEHPYRLDQEAAWMSKTCVCRRLNTCAVSFSWFWLRRPFSITFIRLGSRKPSTGFLPARSVDGLYLLLNGIAAVLSSTATLAFARANPFPRPKGTYG